MSDRHEHLDEGTIHAWLDGALPPDESARAEAAATSCPECAARVAEARGLVAASSRILSALDAVPAGVIPGSDTSGDQLAALRARRRAAAHRWWQDRRVLVAASLMLVAGVSSLVWRASGNDVVAAGGQPAFETVPSPSTPPAPVPPPPVEPSPTPAPTLAREAPARDAKVASSPAAQVRSRVAVERQTDTVAAQKTAPAAASDVGSAVVANEARRADSSAGRALADSGTQLRREAVASERSLRQQGAPRQAVQPFAIDSLQQALRARADVAGAAMLGSVVTTGAAAAAPAPACYALRAVPLPGRRTDPAVDTVQLLTDFTPVLSDPSWYRARIFGTGRDTTLAWRSVDSTTVELRARFGADSVAVRFMITGAVPGIGAARDLRAVVATRVNCPR